MEWGQQTALLFFFLHKINPSNLFLSLLLVVAAHVWCMFGARLTQLDSSSMIELRIPMVLISKDQKSIKNRSKRTIKKNDQKEIKCGAFLLCSSSSRRILVTLTFARETN